MQYVLIALLVLIIIVIARGICIVPQANAWVVEYLGKYHATWQAGLHIRIPILYKVIKLFVIGLFCCNTGFFGCLENFLYARTRLAVKQLICCSIAF